MERLNRLWKVLKPHDILPSPSSDMDDDISTRWFDDEDQTMMMLMRIQLVITVLDVISGSP